MIQTAFTAAFPVDQCEVLVFTCSAADADPPYQQIRLIYKILENQHTRETFPRQRWRLPAAYFI